VNKSIGKGRNMAIDTAGWCILAPASTSLH
jgi:hypothetical protein